MPKTSKSRQKDASLKPSEIASPDVVTAAAEKAPRVFHIGAYFRPIFLMREKGHSWRFISDWLRQFNIEVSYVHLRRLYVQEDARLDEVTAAQKRKLGMPEEMIAKDAADFDPVKRLTAPDPDPEVEPTEEREEPFSP